ncbi:MAG: CopD family protein [Hyphomonadaceae bacterium]|nr:CopD family protein [Hyphomonadaceae bacterium]
MNYDLLRGLHIIAVIAWVAGLLMLPRLYAYQAEAEPGGELSRKMLEAARRLRVIILMPSLLLAFGFGLLLFMQRFAGAGAPPLWITIKIALALVLAGYHGFLAAEGRKLVKGQKPRSGRFWRLMGEVPILISIAIVLLAVLEQPS